ncbi:GntR family transcriptional regulator [Kocuria carniphila]|uniref:GntR family transcriptional regulator n=1 Tax=Kocuria carniphila TaxID=262208 RepID=UPI0028E61CCC|nr:GntR family transcriptional regulator [Kocuria carniphila]
MSTTAGIFTVDTTSTVPVYEQLVQCVTDGIASGSLEDGDRIPPVRALATELGLAAGTVAKSYRAMEASGVIETRGRKGTFIAQSSDDRHAAACRAAAEYLDRTAGDLHYSPEECLRIVQRMLDQRAAG